MHALVWEVLYALLLHRQLADVVVLAGARLTKPRNRELKSLLQASRAQGMMTGQAAAGRQLRSDRPHLKQKHSTPSSGQVLQPPPLVRHSAGIFFTWW